MRTTLDIDQDVLQAAKELAKHQQKTAGQVVSELLRTALNQAKTRGNDSANLQVNEPSPMYGIQPFASRGSVVTNQLIDDLKEDLGL
ncbi:MAG: DUF6364 family protein [Pseudomonadales bacterium]